MTFLEKRDLWKETAEKEITKNPDIMMAWTADSKITLRPNDGTITISYPNPNIKPIIFENAVISIKDFFKTL